MAFGPSPADMESYRAFLATIEPDARRKRLRLTLASSFAAALVLISGVASGHLAQALNAGALICDIGGAGLLTSGLLLSKEMIGEMGANRLGGNDALPLYWRAAKADAYVALTLITLGFAGQIFSDVIGL